MSAASADCGDGASIPHGTEDLSGLPTDHTSRHRQKHQPQEVQQEQYRHVVQAAGVLPMLEHLVCGHPGSQSRLSVEGFLAAALGAAADHKTYKRTDITKAVKDLTDEFAASSGIDGREKRPISYSTVERLALRFESALVDWSRHPVHGEHGWLDEDGMFWRAYWWSDEMIRASIPAEWKERITAIAIDPTCWRNWHKCTENAPKDDLVLEHAQRRAEEYGLDEPDLSDLENPCGTKPGEMGPDGRAIRSKCPSARWGHRTKTEKDDREWFHGHDVVNTRTVRDFDWQGDPEGFQLGGDVPHFAHGTRVIPASANPSPPSQALLHGAKRCFPGLRDAIVDRGISNKRDFIRAAHALGLNVTFDYTTTEVAHPKTPVFGRNANMYYAHVGSLFPGWLDASVVTPPAIRGHKTLDNADVPDEELDQWYIDRAKLACTVNQKFPDGAAQYKSPEADGRISTARNRHRAKPDAPDYSETDTYPELYFNTSLEDRDRLQARPWPTPAWEADYGRRELVETGNSQDKDEGGFSEGSCRVASFVAHIITATLIQVINNLEEARRYPIHQQKRRRKAEREHARSEAQRNGSTDIQPVNEEPGEPDLAETADANSPAQANGHAADALQADRSSRTASAGTTNSSNRRRRNKRRRQPQQRNQATPTGRSPPKN